MHTLSLKTNKQNKQTKDFISQKRVAWYIQSAEKEKFPIKNIVPKKIIIQN